MHNHQDARLLAEELPQNTAIANATNGNIVNPIWNATEYALANAEPHRAGASTHIMSFEEKVKGYSSNKHPVLARVQAGMLYASIPMLARRAEQASPSAADIKRARVRNADTLRLALSYSGRVSSIEGALGEAVLFGLLSSDNQTDLPAYYSSPREEASTTPVNNHDLYCITDTGVKVPIQAKVGAKSFRSGAWGAGVLQVSTEALLKDLPLLDDTVRRASTRTRGMASLLTRSVRGIREREREAIDHARESLEAQIQLFALRICHENGKRLPLNHPIDTTPLFDSTDLLLSFTETDRDGRLAAPRTITARDRVVTYDQIKTSRSDTRRAVRLFEEGTEVYAVSLEQDESIMQLSFVQNALLRQVVGNRANKTTSWQ